MDEAYPGTVEVRPGEDTPGIDAALARGGSISGRVTSEEGDPLAGICARASGAQDDWPDEHVRITDAEGRYLIGRLRTDAYRVFFHDCTAGAWASEWYDDEPDWVSADPVPVTEGADTGGIDAALAPYAPAPWHDAAITALTVENVADEATGAYSGWMRRVSVGLSNAGPGDAPGAAITVWACPRGMPYCTPIGGREIDLAAGASRTEIFAWNGLGMVGDVDVTAELSSQGEVAWSNNVARAEHYVLVGGTGIGTGVNPLDWMTQLEE